MDTACVNSSSPIDGVMRKGWLTSKAWQHEISLPFKVFHHEFLYEPSPKSLSYKEGLIRESPISPQIAMQRLFNSILLCTNSSIA